MKAIEKLTLIGITVVIIFSCRETQFTPVSNDDIITLSIDSTRLIANGESTTAITVEVNSDADEAFRSVTLNFDAGTVDGKTETTSLRVNKEGRASFILVADTFETTTNVTASITNGTDTYSATGSVTFYKPALDSVLRIELKDTTNKMADGESTFQVQAFARDYSSRLRFEVVNATIVNNNAQSFELDQGPTSTSILVRTSNTPDQIIIKAKLLGTNFEKTISYKPNEAKPDNITVIPALWSIDSTVNQNILCTAQLSRSFGKVTSNQRIRASAYQTAGNEVGSFLPILARSDANGQATLTLTTAKALTRGVPLTLVFEADGNPGVISDTIRVDVP
jgi:hypothetical protein